MESIKGIRGLSCNDRCGHNRNWSDINFYDRIRCWVLLRKGWMTMDEKKSAMKIIEEVCEDICNRYCKYGDTVDEDGECEVGRGGEECPLMRLY